MANSRIVNPDVYGFRRDSDHAILSDGRIVVVWSNTPGTYDQTTSFSEIFAQILDEDFNPVGQPFQVNSYTLYDQIKPQVIALPGGGFSVIWQSYAQDGFLEPPNGVYEQKYINQYGIVQQVFDNNAQRVGDEQIVNEHVDGYQFDPSVEFLLDGGYLVFWDHINFISTNAPYSSRYFQRFDQNGEKVGNSKWWNYPSEFDGLSEYPTGKSSALDLGDGTIAVAWTEVRERFLQISIRNLDGEEQFRWAVSGGEETAYSPELVLLPNGFIFVTWSKRGDVDNSGVFGAVYSKDGSEVVPAFQISPFNNSPVQYIEDVIILDDGNILVSWHDLRKENILARVVSPEGVVLSEEIALSPPGPRVDEARVTLAADGSIIVTYNSELFDVAQLPHKIEEQIFIRKLFIDPSPQGTTFGAEANYYTAVAVGETVLSGAGNDTIIGGDGDDRLFGEDGSDSLEGSGGNDSLDGAEGNDTLIGGDGDDALSGGSGNNWLDGGDGNDELVGGSGDDTLLGGAGSDALFGGEGDNSIDGGAGDDLIVAGTSGRGEFIDWFGENTILGGSGNDTISAIGPNQQVDGGAGNDLIQIQDYVPADIKPEGVSRNIGGAGNDTLQGGQYLDGGIGDDLIVGFVSSTMVGGEGIDTLLINGFVNIETGWVGNGDDHPSRTLEGEHQGFEIFEFIRGDGLYREVNEIVGSPNADTVIYPGNVFFADLGGGDDYVYSRSRDVVPQYDLVPHVTIYAGSGDDTILSGHEPDTVFGGAGHDLISTDSSADVLVGEAGDDTLNGGEGADLFVMAPGDGRDTIEDFEKGQSALDGDKIDVTAYRITVNDVVFEAGDSGLLVKLGSDSIFLEGFLAPALDETDFIGFFTPELGEIDFDGNGFEDILWRNTDGTIGYWAAQSDGSHNFVRQGKSDPGWEIEGIADFDNNGLDDILWRNTDNGVVGYWASQEDGSHTFVREGKAGLNWEIQGTGDFDGNGFEDILWRNSDGTVGYWAAQPDGSHGFVRDGKAGLNWEIEGIADFDNNGLDDILWRNTDNGVVGYWASQEDGSHTFVREGKAGLNWEIQGTGDFDGNGFEDILWRNSDGTVGYWASQPDGSHGFVRDGKAGLNWEIEGIADFDNNGLDDILWRNTDNGVVGYWASQEDGSHTFVREGKSGLNWDIQHSDEFIF